MDGEQRWWIVEEIARWWRQASEAERWLLMQRGIEGTKEATLAEIQAGALVAELTLDDAAHEIIEAWSSGKGIRRC